MPSTFYKPLTKPEGAKGDIEMETQLVDSRSPIAKETAEGLINNFRERMQNQLTERLSAVDRQDLIDPHLCGEYADEIH